MLFSSLSFLFAFLPLFFICYFLFKRRSARNFVLFVFSLLFYAWGEPLYIFLMLFSLTANYLFAIWIDKREERKRKTVLVLAVIFNLALLGVFKYAGFAVETFNGITGLSVTIPKIVLPIGISFYTFQILSYVIDVYRGTVKCQKNWAFLGAYLAAFPQLIAGPIVRYKTVENELENRTESISDFSNGLRRFIFGLAKKVLIANTVASVCDKLLEFTPVELGALGGWVAAISYTLQIYFDFSGYSDMAIGLGRMMGFHYLENFNYPYIARSVTDFWRRWHISLSTFFKDYVYIPLGGNRVSLIRWILNMGIVWFLTGLWHGASWNFVLWGVYYFVLLIIEKLLAKKIKIGIPVLGNIVTLLLVIMGWVMFRAEDVSFAWQWLASMFGAFGAMGTGSNLAIIFQQCDVNMVYIITLFVGAALCAPIAKKLTQPHENIVNVIGIIRDIICLVLLMLCIANLASDAYNPFIYFRF